LEKLGKITVEKSKDKSKITLEDINMGNIGVWNVDDKGIEHRGTLKRAD